jgi:hypothetical protein
MSQFNGIITKFDCYLAAGETSPPITVINSNITVDSVFLVSVSAYSGAGIPVVRANVSDGFFDVVITNVHSSEGVGAFKISYSIV